MASSDILGEIAGNESSNNQNNSESTNQAANLSKNQELALLKSIDSTLKQILKSGPTWSQSDAHNMMPGRQYGPDKTTSDKWRIDRNSRGKNSTGLKSDGSQFKGILDEFEDGLREALMEGLFGSDIKKNLSASLNEFGDSIGVNLRDVPKHLGKHVMSGLGDAFKQTSLGKEATDYLNKKKGEAVSKVKDIAMSSLSKYDESVGNIPGSKDSWSGRVSGAIDNLSSKSKSTKGTGNKADSSELTAGTVQISQSDLLAQIAQNVEIIAEFARHELSVDKNKQIEIAEQYTNSDTKPEFYDSLIDKAIPEVQSLSSLKDKALSQVGDVAGNALGDAGNVADLIKGSGMDAITSVFDDVIGKKLVGSAGKLMGSISKVVPALSSIPGAALAVGAGLIALKVAAWALGPAIEGTKELFEGMGKAANRYNKSRKGNLKYEQQRIADDVETLIREPFKILEDAATAWYEAWDNNLRKINATQGYSKDDLYDLMGSYSERLRSEGLTSVVSSSDITTNLSSVLDSGLSGKVAEEFAYLATKLNAAVPTQDFFSYGETYASLAANAIKNGKSEAEAIQYANEQMESFASNVLYASRQLSGGFSTGLKDAQSIFESSVQIATASRTGDPSEISGVLTSVAAIVGSIAPDLSSSIVESVVNAAVGGNSSEIVALRSLAGINASNTEFIRAIANDPQSVFAELFTNLGEMQNMSADAYMEVAEGVAEIFGLQKEALQRVDFNYLAQAISQMNVNNASLDENIKLLASGETTTTAEQLKMAQINEYMLEEGLSYVMDNAAAREIQKHMWDEQIARELMEANYAVELQGSALKFLEGISQTVNNIISILNPLSWFKGVANLVATAVEGEAQQADLRQLLELGKVGNGNARDLYNLTTTNQDLNLTSSLVEMMGGVSAYELVSTGLDIYNGLANLGTTTYDLFRAGKSGASALIQNALTSSLIDTGRNSKYTWAHVGKSTVNAVSLLPGSSYNYSGSPISSQSTQVATSDLSGRFQEFVDSMQSYIDVENPEDAGTYEDWKASASKYGISDFDAAIEKYGRTEEELMGYFQAQEANKAAKHELDRQAVEDEFWDVGTRYWKEEHPAWRIEIKGLIDTVIDNQDTQIELHETTNQLLSDYFTADALKQQTQIDNLVDILSDTSSIDTTSDKYLDEWTKYYVDHTAYTDATFNPNDVAKIQSAERSESGDAVLALAKALTANNIELKDPVVQTNVLLAQILLVAETIMQNTKESSQSYSLPTALSLLGIGATTKSV